LKAKNIIKTSFCSLNGEEVKKLLLRADFNEGNASLCRKSFIKNINAFLKENY
jgi:hypothetical protein